MNEIIITGSTGVIGALARSQRISNRRLREASGWAPKVRAATESWRRIIG